MSVLQTCSLPREKICTTVTICRCTNKEFQLTHDISEGLISVGWGHKSGGALTSPDFCLRVGGLLHFVPGDADLDLNFFNVVFNILNIAFHIRTRNMETLRKLSRLNSKTVYIKVVIFHKWRSYLVMDYNPIT